MIGAELEGCGRNWKLIGGRVVGAEAQGFFLDHKDKLKSVAEDAKALLQRRSDAKRGKEDASPGLSGSTRFLF